MKLSGVRLANSHDLHTVPFEYTTHADMKTYIPQHCERIEKIETEARSVVLNGSIVVWRAGVMLARTRAGREGFVVEPGDRVEEST